MMQHLTILPGNFTEVEKSLLAYKRLERHLNGTKVKLVQKDNSTCIVLFVQCKLYLEFIEELFS